METILNKILADIPLFKKVSESLLKHPDFEIINQGTLGANHWRFMEYEFIKDSVPFGRFWRPDFWVIKKHGKTVMKTSHYKYCLGICYKKLGFM